MVNLAAAIHGALPELRREAEALLTLTLAAFEPAGKTKNAAGFYELGFTSRGELVGKVQAGSAAGRDTNTRSIRIGDVDRPVLSGGLHIPLTATVPGAGLQRGLGWEYLVTAVGPLDDPALLDRRFLVVGVPAKSYPTTRRLDVVEITGAL